jgi:hypothetical protein
MKLVQAWNWVWTCNSGGAYFFMRIFPMPCDIITTVTPTFALQYCSFLYDIGW